MCLGNICRSPAAEGVMKTLVEKHELTNVVDIDSAGIGDWHIGQLPDKRMRTCGEKRGYCFNSKARQFQIADFYRFDLILVMDKQNYKALKNIAPNKADMQKVKMLAHFAVNNKPLDTIPDPYYGGENDFERALTLIEDATRGLLEYICKQL